MKRKSLRNSALRLCVIMSFVTRNSHLLHAEESLKMKPAY